MPINLMGPVFLFSSGIVSSFHCRTGMLDFIFLITCILLFKKKWCMNFVYRKEHIETDVCIWIVVCKNRLVW